jgi:tellurite resistance protein TehA-like permease
MGTGLLSLLLHELPYQFRGLKTISIVVWGLDIVLFSFLFSIFLLRWLKYPHETWKMFEYNVELTVYFACLTIGSPSFLRA